MASNLEKYTKQKCSEHNRKFDSFCYTCGKRMCKMCVKGKHNFHNWTTKGQLVCKFKEERKNYLDQIHNRIIPSLIGNLRLDCMKICAVREKFMALVDEYIDTLPEKMESIDQNDEIQGDIERLQSFASFFQTAIHTAPDNIIVEMIEDFHAHVQKLNYRLNTDKIRLAKGVINTQAIYEMFGHVQMNIYNNDQSNANVDIVDIATLKHGDNNIQSIIPYTNHKAWIHCRNEKHIDVIDYDERRNLQQPARNIGKVLADFCLFNDDVIVSLFKEMEIQRVTKSGDFTTLCSTAPLHPIGLYLPGDSGILVTLGDGNVRDITSSSTGEVRLLNMKGHIRKSFTTRISGIKMFTSPDKIRKNCNNQLCVLDHIDTEFRSRLLVITESGIVRFTYTGQTTLRERFSSEGLCCDEHGRIILSDTLNNAIHILSPDGEFIQFLLTANNDLVRPRAVAMYGNTLWIGCNEGIIRVLRLNKMV